MKKYLLLILCAFVAVIALLFYQQYLIDAYPPNEEKTTVTATTALTEQTALITEETTVTAKTSVVETATIAEQTPAAPKTEITNETRITDTVSTVVAVETKPAVKPSKQAGDINSLIEALDIDFPENALAVLINAPDEATLQIAGEYGHFVSSQTEPPSLIIPVYIGSTLTVNSIAGITENGELIYGDRLIMDPMIEDNYSLLFEAIRPEGIPSYAVEITYEDKIALYPYAYNGRDGNEGIEYIIITDSAEPLG